MNDDVREDSDAGEDEESGPVCGERLRAAREEQQISLLEIAKELHLDEPKVRALEDNDFEMLGAPVFAKGHLRKYAELVGVDERVVLGDFHELNRAAGAPPVVGKPRKPGSELSPGPWIVVVLVLLAAAFAYWWFKAGRGPSTDAVPAEAPEPAIEAPAESPMPVEPDAGETAPVPDDASPEPAATEAADAVDTPVTETVVEAPAASEPADDDVRLALAFDEDCWTEVTDATGQRLYFGLGRAGSAVEVSGTAPLSVLLGSATNVTVSVNGETYAITDADRRGNTARLTLP